MSEPKDPVFELFRTENRPGTKVFWFKCEIDKSIVPQSITSSYLRKRFIHNMNAQTELKLRMWSAENFDDPSAIGVMHNDDRVIVVLSGTSAATAFKLRFG